MKNIKIIEKKGHFLVKTRTDRYICSAFSFLGTSLKLYRERGSLLIPLHSGDTVEYRNKILK